MPGGRLAEAAHLSPGAASEMLDGLERMGIVERAAADADRRRRVFSLSAGGARLVEEKLRTLRAEAAEALDGCTDADLVVAARVIDRLTAMLARR